MDEFPVALIGLGTVGGGVARLLLEQGERIERRTGKRVGLRRVVVREPHKARSLDVPAELLSDRLEDVLEDGEIRVAVQLIGGLSPAREIMLRLLEAGKDVVTANKALLAEHGTELFRHAGRLGRAIAFEGAVGGGIPIVAAIGQSLAANRITSISGILNGTSNFILTEMTACGEEYPRVLERAQRAGYAEADPTLDVDGTDAAHKLVILTQLAFGLPLSSADVPRQGIEEIKLADLRYADELGYTVKSLAVARLADGELELHVAPTLVRHETPLAQVGGAYNAVSVVGDPIGDTLYYGLGAGRNSTTSAVVADLIDMVVGRAQITFRHLGLGLDASQEPGALRLQAPERAESRYYLRFTVEDRPGVLADIAGVLGGEGISIASVIQHEAPEDGAGNLVPLVIMTHTASAGSMHAALAEIDPLPLVRAPSVHMRVA
jgi:homoserine dehydrogenase